MKIRSAVIAAISGLLSVAGLAPAQASTTFTYTGADFVLCNNISDCTSENLTGSFTTSLTGTDVEGLSNVDITSTLTALSFNSAAGSATLSFPYLDVIFSTDSNGAVTHWDMKFCSTVGCISPTTGTFTLIHSNGPLGDDFVTTDTCATYCNPIVQGSNPRPGSWTVTMDSAVPEPASWIMMLLGFGGIGASLRARRKQAAAIPA
jgi:hypothetical protein